MIWTNINLDPVKIDNKVTELEAKNNSKVLMSVTHENKLWYQKNLKIEIFVSGRPKVLNSFFFHFKKDTNKKFGNF